MATNDIATSPTVLTPSSKEKGKGKILRRHEEYYIPSADVVFLVENTLFRVHRYFLLRDSPLLRDMLSLPAPLESGLEQEGTSDQHPIRLLQVTSEDFAHFLWVFYNPEYSVYERSFKVWMSILRIAHLWQCDEVRDLVFRELDIIDIPHVERVFLTTRYEAREEWREKALESLAQRPEPLSLDEGKRLGIELIVRIAKLREQRIWETMPKNPVAWCCTVNPPTLVCGTLGPDTCLCCTCPQCLPEQVRHEEYYIPSGDVVFLVDNKLFRVHRYFLLRESSLFREMLSLPAALESGVEQEGTSDQYPILLPQVTSEDFARFLWVFYNPKYSVYEASFEVWMSILRLAHLWQCDEVRDLVFRKLHNVPPVERLLLTIQFEARERWREEALEDLARRHEPLSRKERKLLGKELTVRITEMRKHPIREQTIPNAFPVASVSSSVVRSPSISCPWVADEGRAEAESVRSRSPTSDTTIDPPPAPNQAQPPPMANHAPRLSGVWNKWKFFFLRHARKL